MRSTSIVFLLSCLCVKYASTSCPDAGIITASSNSSTWPQGFDFGESSNIILDFPLLLDSESPRLSGLKIISGGSLVFSSGAEIAKLVTNFVIIEAGGSLIIGNENCSFEGNAEIVLTGERGSYETDDGEKFISVRQGGTLEIHGKPKKSWTRLNGSVIRGEGPRTINFLEDVSSWQSGDTIVLASTDYDPDQAETVIVENCDLTRCVVNGLLKYDHFGEIDSHVDMRGEVGLLTRNILIRGELESACYGNQLCQHFKVDTFGGHIIAHEGFASFKVENAELTNLGQQAINGRYPLHWHMAGNIPSGTSYVRSNSIHHTLQRCITCHGSHGCLIEDNVCFDSLGHSFFMEDGVEKGTVMTRNLGLSTRKGFMIPSDADPATFWITHPDSFITDNVAAGSAGKGFWFLQASLPTGLSGQLQKSGEKYYFGKDELFRTPIGSISGNIAHSSVFGFFFDSILLPNQGASKTPGKYSPKTDPKDPTSASVSTQITDLTCYKSQMTCIWMHLPNAHYSNIRTADSGEGMFVRKESVIDQSVFVGESSANFGVPNKRINRNLWYRSLPRQSKCFGFRNYVNPMLIKNSIFISFGDTDAQILRALAVRAVSFRSLFTGASNLTFSNTKTTGKFLEDKMPKREFLYKDYTGSISSHANSYLIQNFPHLTSIKCAEFPDWGSISVCPHRYVSINIGRTAVSVIRTDMPDNVYVPKKETKLFLSADHTYIISFPFRFPIKQSRDKMFSDIIVGGVDDDISFSLGICVPMNSSISVNGHTEVTNIDDLHNNITGDVFFYDDKAGLIFLKYVGTFARQTENIDVCGMDKESCISKV